MVWTGFVRSFARLKACLGLVSLMTLRERCFKMAFVIAMPCAVVSCTIKLLEIHHWGEGEVARVVSGSAYNSIVVLLSLLTVFRTSQSYSRYWEGCEHAYQMVSDFYDAAAGIISFCHESPADAREVRHFAHMLVRLCSLLHGLLVAELADAGDILEVKSHFRLIDFKGLSEETRGHLEKSHHKSDLVFQWVHTLLVHAVKTHIIVTPAPIVSRSFVSLHSGISQFHRCLKIVESPFPFPYTAVSEMILIMHWAVTPIIACTWTERASAALCLTFIAAFVLWSLHGIAAELENPFEQDAHDLDLAQMQDGFNRRLLDLLQHSTLELPKLSDQAVKDVPTMMASLGRSYKPDSADRISRTSRTSRRGPWDYSKGPPPRLTPGQSRRQSPRVSGAEVVSVQDTDFNPTSSDILAHGLALQRVPATPIVDTDTDFKWTRMDGERTNPPGEKLQPQQQPPLEPPVDDNLSSGTRSHSSWEAAAAAGAEL